jgi:L-alanine-DL-glutamate epimerase-like enolase superfamily enzyme
MTPPRLKVLDVRCFERPYQLRIPFRFGIKTATGGRQAVVAVRIRLDDGREAEGWSAEALSAKWFDKNPELSDDENHHQLRRSIELASAAYRASPPQTAFRFFEDHYAFLNRACAAEALNPLIASFGMAMLDRAVFDALCRAHNLSFADAMAANLSGMGASTLVPELAGFDFNRFLASLRPAATIAIRHTVGLVDPLVAADQESRVDDGLPETLSEVIATYGCRYYKIKVGGDLQADIDRLRRITSLLDESGIDYRVTLDGNEQFDDRESVEAFLSALDSDPQLQPFMRSILCLEQPIRRDRALQQPLGKLAARIPVIIDESDGELDAFASARALGYSGVSSKVCKGLYKSVINAARATRWNDEEPGRYFLSAEDLTCEPGISLQQDLALVSWLGLTHVEKNAHHFIDGFDRRPDSEAEAFLAAHPDLYHWQDGRVRLHVRDGQVKIGSLSAKGFGTALAPDVTALEPMPVSTWQVRSI